MWGNGSRWCQIGSHRWGSRSWSYRWRGRREGGREGRTKRGTRGAHGSEGRLGRGGGQRRGRHWGQREWRGRSGLRDPQQEVWQRQGGRWIGRAPTRWRRGRGGRGLEKEAHMKKNWVNEKSENRDNIIFLLLLDTGLQVTRV